MPIEIACPQCQQMLRVPDEAAGKKARCPACQTIVDVPITAVEILPESPFDARASDDNAYRSPAEFPPPPYPSKSLGDDAAIRMLLPVGRSLWAIAAGYFGLFSLICFPAPIAIILGLIAIRDIRKHPEKHGLGRAIFGLVMGVLCSIGFVVLLMNAGR
ncbi:MAG TPA: DUF4190 domain-containing protein [Pirellulales bacterium]|nr:DUF4190 domain-containing protein [Pirellulales bacterium]